jgi:hypothetical protein
MPIEIRELVIRVTVNEKKAVQQSANAEKDKLLELKSKIVKECVEKVLSAMENISAR